MADDRVWLLLDGRALAGWKSVSITRSLEEAAGRFELSVSERLQRQPRARIRSGVECAVRIGDTPMIRGYVDRVRAEIDKEQHTFTVAGRDRVADLIDCSPDVPPSEWTDVTLLELGQELARPFGIEVIADVDVGAPFERVALSPGQRAFELLEERARQRQVLLVSDADGRLVLTRPDQSRAAPITEGVNFKRGAFEESTAERFSLYTVKGEGFLGPEFPPPEARAKDVGVPRFRPMLIVPSGDLDEARCRERAQWEATYRRARGERAEVTVAGWRQPSGEVWPVGARVVVDIPSLGLSGERLISSTTFSLTNDRGTETRLVLDRPGAFEPMPETADEDDTEGF